MQMWVLIERSGASFIRITGIKIYQSLEEAGKAMQELEAKNSDRFYQIWPDNYNAYD